MSKLREILVDLVDAYEGKSFVNAAILKELTDQAEAEILELVPKGRKICKELRKYGCLCNSCELPENEICEAALQLRNFITKSLKGENETREG